MKKVIRRVEEIFLGLTVIIFLIIVIFAYIAHKNNQEFFIFGYKPYIITPSSATADSMQPEIKVYGLVIINKGDYSKVKVGDTIFFNEKGFSFDVCHEVIEISDNHFVTKGLNNKNADPNYVTKDNYIGRVVFHTNIIANYFEFVQQRGVFSAVILPLVIIIAIILGLKLLIKKLKHYIETKKT